MTERFELDINAEFISIIDNEEKIGLNLYQAVDLLNHLHQENHSLKFQLDECANNKLYSRRKLEEENEQLRDELTFLNKVIGFFADNPMTKYSSKSELLEEMKFFEKRGLI